MTCSWSFQRKRKRKPDDDTISISSVDSLETFNPNDTIKVSSAVFSRVLPLLFLCVCVCVCFSPCMCVSFCLVSSFVTVVGHFVHVCVLSRVL